MFERAKKAAKENFARNYKNEVFRMLYKAFEISDSNKGLSLKELIEDIEKIDIDIFKKCAETLITTGNICIYASGDTNGLDLGGFEINPVDAERTKQIVPVGTVRDPYLKSDSHILNIARNAGITEILYFDFINPDVTVFTKKFLTEILAEQINTSNKILWTDAFDTSLIFTIKDLRRYKDDISVPEENAFNKSKNNIISNYLSMRKDYPEQYCINGAALMQVGIYINQYIEFLGRCSAAMFGEIYQKANLKVTEAQIVLMEVKK